MMVMLRKEKLLAVPAVFFSVYLTFMCLMLNPSLKCIRDTRDENAYYRSLTDGIAAAAINTQTDQPLAELHQMNISYLIDAEYTSFSEGAVVDTLRSGYHGIGYVTFLPEHTDNALQVTLTVPYTQHYAITVSAAADCNTVNAINVNGNRITEFELDDREKFTRVTIHGIFLEEGSATVSIDTIDANLDVDYIGIKSEKPPEQDSFEIAETPCNPDASPEAAELYRTIRSQWGKSTLTGQYVSDGSNRELRMIYQQTGQFPAIRFSALGSEDNRTVIDDAAEWHMNMKGIVGLMWFWNAPGTDSVYAKDSGFNLNAALRGTDPKTLALCSAEELNHAVESGMLTESARDLIRDIDDIAGQLRVLRDLHIPVLWRPLHEAGGEWYWWGSSGSVSYQMLWKLLYYRLTDYHALNNLIWIWNGQSKSYLVPESTYDIASADIYLQPGIRFGSRYEVFHSLAAMTNSRKMIAVSECGTTPETGQMILDQSVWSFFGMWYGDYLMKSDGSFSDLYYSSNDLYILYNSERTLTLNDFLSICQ